MWICSVVALAAACALLLIQVVRIRRQLNLIADCAAAWCESEHG